MIYLNFRVLCTLPSRLSPFRIDWYTFWFVFWLILTWWQQCQASETVSNNKGPGKSPPDLSGSYFFFPLIFSFVWKEVDFLCGSRGFYNLFFGVLGIVKGSPEDRDVRLQFFFFLFYSLVLRFFPEFFLWNKEWSFFAIIST